MAGELVNKKILICIPFLTLGGAETQALLLADFLKNESRADVEFCAFYKKDGKLIERLDALGIRYHIFDQNLSCLHRKGLAKVGLVRHFIRFLRRNNYQFIIPFTYYPNVLCNISWRFTGAKKCFWNQRGMETLAVSRLERIAIRCTTAFIGNSEASISYILKRHEIKNKSYQIIRNGLPVLSPLADSNTWRKKIGLIPGDFCIVYVANFFPEKDHSTLLHALKRIIAEHVIENNPRLVLVGYAPDEDLVNKVKAIVLDLNLQNNVIFVNSTGDIAGLLNAADLAVITSVSEGMSNALLEYMESKLAVVASDIPSNIEVLGGDYPYFFQAGNCQELAGKISKLMNGPEDRAKTGERNFIRVNKNFNTQKMCNEYVNLLVS